jgi:hypothetical protein
MPEDQPKLTWNKDHYKAITHQLDELLYILDDAHHPECRYLKALEGDKDEQPALSEGDCNCGLQKVEEAYGVLQDAVEEAS